jgi:uncharacterized tellurite resistance protein B-like protein
VTDQRLLEQVFTRALLDAIARADDLVRPDEAELVERICPSGPLRSAGLLDERGKPTPAFDAARSEALDLLPARLPLGRKHAIVTSLLDLCVVDGHHHRDDSSLLFRAAQLLGVSTSDFDRHLDTLTDLVGNVDLE